MTPQPWRQSRYHRAAACLGGGSEEVRVIFKVPSAGFLVTPPAAEMSPRLMSPMASGDVFTRLNQNSGNDSTVTLFHCTFPGHTEGYTDSAKLIFNSEDRKCNFHTVGAVVPLIQRRLYNFKSTIIQLIPRKVL